jgi:hypothetical protein
MSDKLNRHLLTLYTRTSLHVGSGTSVDVVDLPIMRERITAFPIIPAPSLKGILPPCRWPAGKLEVPIWHVTLTAVMLCSPNSSCNPSPVPFP